GVDVKRAESEMTGITNHLAELYPNELRGWGVAVVALRDEIFGTIRPATLILLGAAGLVLAIAWANVATLLLARSASRQREVAVRLALGATRFRVIRRCLVESTGMALFGGTIGLLLSVWGTRTLVALAPAELALSSAALIDGRLLGFTLVI